MCNADYGDNTHQQFYILDSLSGSISIDRTGTISDMVHGTNVSSLTNRAQTFQTLPKWEFPQSTVSKFRARKGWKQMNKSRLKEYVENLSLMKIDQEWKPSRQNIIHIQLYESKKHNNFIIEKYEHNNTEKTEEIKTWMTHMKINLNNNDEP